MPAEVLAELARGPMGHVLAAVLGALFGSFANVCIVRMPPTDEHPKGRSVASPGSHCGACGHPVRWYDNIPLVSFLWLRGRCRDCGVEFSPRYLLVEAATAMLFAACWHFVFGIAHTGEPVGLQLFRAGVLCAFVFTLVVITFIDLDHKLILDKITYPAIPLFYGLSTQLPEHDWNDGLIGAVVGYGVVRLIADGYYLVTRREGMGYGDGKLLAVIGALFGWQAVVVSLFFGSLLGSVISIAVLVRARRAGPGEVEPEPAPEAAPGDDGGEPGPDTEGDAELALRHVEVPFGPFLAAGALLYLFLEPALTVRFGILWGRY